MNDDALSILVSESVSDIVEAVGLNSSWRLRIYSMLKPKFEIARQSTKKSPVASLPPSCLVCPAKILDCEVRGSVGCQARLWRYFF